MATPFHAEVVTPERILFSGEVEEVTMRTDAGEISFLAAHEDYVAAADVTVVRLSVVAGAPAGRPGSGAQGGRSGGPTATAVTAHQAPDDSGVQVLRAAVHGGFVQVDQSGVVILASVAELAGEIDVERARRSLEAAEAALPSGDRPAEQVLAEVAASGAAGGEAHGLPSSPSAAPGTIVSPSPAMLALLAPDSPEMRARRARVRLEAAGAA